MLDDGVSFCDCGKPLVEHGENITNRWCDGLCNIIPSASPPPPLPTDGQERRVAPIPQVRRSPRTLDLQSLAQVTPNMGANNGPVEDGPSHTRQNVSDYFDTGQPVGTSPGSATDPSIGKIHRDEALPLVDHATGCYQCEHPLCGKTYATVNNLQRHWLQKLHCDPKQLLPLSTLPQPGSAVSSSEPKLAVVGVVEAALGSGLSASRVNPMPPVMTSPVLAALLHASPAAPNRLPPALLPVDPGGATTSTGDVAVTDGLNTHPPTPITPRSASISARLGDEQAAITSPLSPQSPLGPATPPAIYCDAIRNSDFQSSLLSLANVTPRYKPLPRAATKCFVDLCDQLGAKYTSNPSETALFRILAVPKVCLSGKYNVALAPALRSFPHVLWPAPRQSKLPSSPPTLGKTVERLVEQGRTSTAARHLANTAAPVHITTAIADSLANLHPSGPTGPFSLPSRNGSDKPIPEELFRTVLDTLKADLAPGLTGWTVPLLRLAYQAPGFRSFVSRITEGIRRGSAPGSSLLTVALLISIPKANNKVRPIAISKILYRFAMKVIVRNINVGASLLPSQFGVGTKGGVEPIVHTLNLALTGGLPSKYTHFTMLDAVNAFNCADRGMVARACATHCPDLFRAAKWSYNRPSPMALLMEDDSIRTIMSSQGVRQGDPLSAILFSLVMRPFLEKLQEHLGPKYLVLAYLDDIFILAQGGDAEACTHEFIATCTSPVRLNPAKCSTLSLEVIKDNGAKLLGTALGSVQFRDRFLVEKIAQLEHTLNNLSLLPHHHALYLLRHSLQLSLRHLLRTPGSPDLSSAWIRLDTSLWRQVRRMRGAGFAQPDRASLFDALGFLPVKFGGLGILTHQKLSTIASEAASAALSLSLAALFPTLPPPTDVRTQWERCIKFHTLSRNTLFTAFSMAEKCWTLEAASQVGSAWLSVAPTSVFNLLSNFKVTSALRIRLGRPFYTRDTCLQCSRPHVIDHADACLKNPMGSTIRHNQIVRACARLATSLNGVAATFEPPIEGSVSLRNDLRLTVLASARLEAVDVDVSLVALKSNRPAPSRSPTRPLPTGSELVTDATACIQMQLRARHKEKVDKVSQYPAYLESNVFRPLIISAGGVLEESSLDLVKTWLAAAPSWARSQFWISLSLTIVRCRAPSSG